MAVFNRSAATYTVYWLKGSEFKNENKNKFLGLNCPF
jgi:hypothetical protein